MVISVDDLSIKESPVQDEKEAPAKQARRKKKPVKTVRIERTRQEWKKIVEEAKMKETFWTKGILPSSAHLVNTSVIEELEED